MENASKNSLFNQEIITENKTFKYKTFDYFYTLLNGKYVSNSFTLYVLHFLEIMQIISFALSTPLVKNWKIKEDTTAMSNIFSGFRLIPLLQFVPLTVTKAIFFVFLTLVFVLSLMFIIQIIFIKENAKIYNKFISSAKYLAAPLTVFFHIPITELFFLFYKCENNKIFINGDTMKCWSSIHYIYVVLGTIGAVLFLVFLLIFNNFCFYPFPMHGTTIKLNSYIDVLILLSKFIFEINYIFIKNEYVSLAIFIIITIFIK